MAAPIRLFVGNLPNEVNENELRNAFTRFGEITALDIKTKPSVENDKKLFAFITLLGSNYDIESCIQHFTNGNFKGNRLYVTRARESFLERLQREREQAQRKEVEKNNIATTKTGIKPLKVNLHANHRKLDANNSFKENGHEKKSKKMEKQHKGIKESKIGDSLNVHNSYSNVGAKTIDRDDKKQNSEKKRLESMKKKRQEFNEKKMIIKTGLIGIDKAANKKTIFSDGDDSDEKIQLQNGVAHNNSLNSIEGNKRKRKLFEEGDDSDTEVNFEIKQQFEGKKGQKVLDLQSRYKSDKRFVLDERFIEDDKSDEEALHQGEEEDVEIGQEDEKYKQLNILQDVLGVPIKMKQAQDSSKPTKSKLGMPRFDPTQPDHAKFLAPVETKQDPAKKPKKKKSKETPEEESVQEQPAVEKVEVSKEQFYKVTDTLKETLEQPNTFSLRSLFGKEADSEANEEMPEQVYEHVPQVPKSKKVINPLDPGEKNPFVYDSSDSEDEDTKMQKEITPQVTAPKPVWRENLFFSESDERLKDGLLFFTQNNETKSHKDRRELKSVMKKRVYNKERKNQMFQKKIGGRRKTVKKNFRKKS